MTKRVKWLLSFALTAGAMGFTSARSIAEVDPGDAALAERFSQQAQTLLRVSKLSNPAYHRSISLIRAAIKLNPEEPRFPALLIEAMLAAKDGPGAIEAVKTYRQLVPNDRVAQIQLVELYTGAQETAEGKIKYLQHVVGQTPVPEEVRSYAATLCAQVFLDRGQPVDADGMLGQALRLNPLNLQALRLRYHLANKSRPPFERATTLMAMLRSNPKQPDVASSLADVLASEGLYEQALFFYNFAGELSTKMSVAMSPNFGIAYASTLFCFDQPASAGQLMQAVLQNDLENIDALFLKLIIDKNSGDTQAYTDSMARTRNALANRIAYIRQAAGDEQATTRPIDAAGDPVFTDPADDLKIIKASEDPGLMSQYRGALTNLAWFHIYFAKQPDIAQKFIEAMKAATEPGNPVVARLEGWLYLTTGRNDEARQKLSAIEKTDPLAALGLLRLPAPTDADRQKLDARARQLVSENASGLLGVILWDELKNRVQRTLTDAGEAIKTETDRFPYTWLTIIDSPHLFYVLRAEPLSISLPFAAPVLARITLQNHNNYDMTIGAEGILHPDLWIDASTRGMAPRTFPGTAYDRMGQTVLLKAGQSISQVVRVDQGELAQFLQTQPGVSIQIFASITSNPGKSGNGIAPALGGYRVQFLNVMERQGAPINSEEDKSAIYKRLESGNAAEKMQILEMLGMYTAIIRDNAENKQAIPIASEFSERVDRAAANGTDAVRAWASYLHAMLTTPENRSKVVTAMTADESLWTKRLLGVTLVGWLEPAAAMELMTQMSKNDPEPLVRDAAAATLQLLEMGQAHSATSQPVAPVAPLAPPPQ